MAALEYVLSSYFPAQQLYLSTNTTRPVPSPSLLGPTLLSNFFLPFVVWAESIWCCSYDVSVYVCRVHELYVSLCIRDVPNWARVPKEKKKKNHKRSESVAGIGILIFTLLSPKKPFTPPFTSSVSVCSSV